MRARQLAHRIVLWGGAEVFLEDQAPHLVVVLL
jgi:hypothetical protein